MTRVGYARGEDLEHQLQVLRHAGCEHLYVDRTGPREGRPELDRAVADLHRGDTLMVVRLAAPAKNLKQLLKLARTLHDRGVALVVTGADIEHLTLSDAGHRELLVDVDACLRELIAEGTRAGLADGRARGRHGGRRAKLNDAQLASAQALYDAREMTVDDIAAKFGVARGTLYRHLDTNPNRPGAGTPR